MERQNLELQRNNDSILHKQAIMEDWRTFLPTDKRECSPTRKHAPPPKSKEWRAALSSPWLIISLLHCETLALRSIIRYALQASSADLSWKASDRFSTDYEEMRRKQGVRYYVTPDDILKAQLTAWRKIIARESANSRIFKRIIDSQMRFAKRVVGFENDLTPSSKMAFDFWFSTV